MRIPPFKEINPPNKKGYWINPKTKESYGGQYISPLLIPNLQKVEKCFEKALKDKKFMKGLEEKADTFSMSIKTHTNHTYGEKFS